MNNDKELYNDFRRRSYRSCVSDAFRTTRKTIWPLTKANWKLFLFLALMQGAIGVWTEYLTPGVMYVGFELHPLSLFMLAIVALATYLTISSKMFATINGRGLRWNFTRQLKTLPVSAGFLIVFLLLSILCIYFCIVKGKNPDSIPLLNALSVPVALSPILLIFSLPLAFAFTQYIMEPERKLYRSLWKSYSTGFRRWGFIFTTIALGELCVIIFQTFVCLPNYILTTAHNYSAIGVSSYNDAPDLPAYFYPLLFGVSTFSGMVKICVTLFEVYTLYYMYQTICIRQKERKM
ncbi:hypothetical protein [uncultured Prevotella sp.]|uniref:hypothetical protein n=1 Tax=uncultured Prevotella sp. TaxID=159272 RepID=UPI002597C61B|nr:hypothetical protein [uncultured Prevotella sp.]